MAWDLISLGILFLIIVLGGMSCGPTTPGRGRTPRPPDHDEEVRSKQNQSRD